MMTDQPATINLATVEKAAAVAIPVAVNATKTVKYYLTEVGINLNGAEMKSLVNGIIYMVENDGQLHPDVANANIARDAEVASHIKQAADAIEMNKPK